MEDTITSLVEKQGITSVSESFSDDRVIAEFNAMPFRSHEYHLFEFDTDKMSHAVIEEMNAKGCVAANLRELLEWRGWEIGAPEDNRMVVALGTAFTGFGRPELKEEWTPFFRFNMNGKQLGTTAADAWNPHTQFLAVKLS